MEQVENEFTSSSFVMTDKVTEKDFTAARLKKLNTLLESGKTVALLYSIHCGHCHDFMPSWKDFRSQMGKKVNVIVLEATAVQHIMHGKDKKTSGKDWHTSLGKIIGAKKSDPHPAVYFPMIVGFFKKSSAKKVNRKEYSGDRSSEDLIEFVKSHVSIPEGGSKKASSQDVPSAPADPLAFLKINKQLDDILGKLAMRFS